MVEFGQAVFEKIDEQIGIWVVSSAAANVVAFVVNHHVEGLCVSVKARGLQVGPLVANGFDPEVLSAVFLDTVLRLRKCGPVVDVQ